MNSSVWSIWQKGKDSKMAEILLNCPTFGGDFLVVSGTKKIICKKKHWRVHSKKLLNKNVRKIKFLDLKSVFSKKTTKYDKNFTVYLTLTTYCQIDGEDFFNFCGLLRKHEL